MELSREKRIMKACLFAFTVNILLFGIKLYIGLSTNSISIYSDAVNNMFDSLSGMLTFICVMLIARSGSDIKIRETERAELLFGFIISVIVTITGFVFVYSSIERFMYPTPVWYTNLYLVILFATSAVKLLMFAYYRRIMKTLDSDVLKAMKLDSILDFFISLLASLSLVLSGTGTFAFDAVFGVVIGVVISVFGIRETISDAIKIIRD